MFGAKRKARKIGQDEEDDGEDVKMKESAENGEGEPQFHAQSAAYL